MLIRGRAAIHFLPDQNFDCESCTKCCRGWRIRVDDASRQTIERLRGKHTLTVQQAKTYAQKHGDGSCVFLQDSRCSVQEVKPAGCRQFPFRATRTPDGVYVGVSFYCSAVQRNSGRPLAEHAAEVADLLHDLPLVGAEALLVHHEGRLLWEGYKVLDAFLAEGHEEGLARALWSLCRLRGVAGSAEIGALLEESSDAATPPHEPFFVAERHFTAQLLGKVDPAARLSALLPAAEPVLQRYLRALVFRKFLITRRPVLHNMAAVFLLPGLFGSLAALLGPERALDRCEYLVFTHGTACDEIFAQAAEEFFWAAS